MRFIFTILLLLFGSASVAQGIRVGSKKFTESVVLGELARLLAVQNGLRAEHKKELGGTRILWKALHGGDIDIYPEYTGTIQQEILAGKKFNNFSEIEKYLNSIGLSVIVPLGFNNTYALGMLKSRAKEFGITKISDLRKHFDLVFGFGNEFMDRGDGWPALRRRYRLPQKDVRGLDHDLAYRGLVGGSLDLMDLYATDAEIEYYDLFVIKDNLNHFPEYNALYVYRTELEKEYPEFVKSISALRGRIPDSKMIRMNKRAKIDGIPAAQIASDFLNEEFKISIRVKTDSFWSRLVKNTNDHLLLVLISLSAAIFISIPLGIFSVRHPRIGQIVISVTGIIQTIPSLAILVFMIPLLGIGAGPALMALFLYSLLPVVRNTHSGIIDIPKHLIESADALGMTDFEKMRYVQVPLAARSILSGIKTAAVINVGIATLGALIGAGGYGQPILTGIRLDDIGLILEGAVPAALLALLVQGGFDLLERIVLPRGLRLKD
ncbi:MAG: ABC transporter permease subunit [Spirochaetes bacterium]|nr:ABC transporter permease subunit [Spirochaetota bacterium]